MLPELDRRFGPDGFEARIVGGSAPPPELADSLSHPAVSLAGHTEDPTAELQRAHCLLVPTSIPLGIRVRILTGLAHGSVIVTHTANAQGIPELEDSVNALMGSTPVELAAAVERALDPEVRAVVHAGARRTYESAFIPARAAGRLESLLKSVASQRGSVGVAS
jgi:glycosyltransferase involved in cell wall biosynthesis